MRYSESSEKKSIFPSESAASENNIQSYTEFNKISVFFYYFFKTFF